MISRAAVKAVAGGWKSGCGANVGGYTTVGGQLAAVGTEHTRQPEPLSFQYIPETLSAEPWVGRRKGRVHGLAGPVLQGWAGRPHGGDGGTLGAVCLPGREWRVPG